MQTTYISSRPFGPGSSSQTLECHATDSGDAMTYHRASNSSHTAASLQTIATTRPFADARRWVQSRPVSSGTWGIVAHPSEGVQRAADPSDPIVMSADPVHVDAIGMPLVMGGGSWTVQNASP